MYLVYDLLPVGNTELGRVQEYGLYRSLCIISNNFKFHQFLNRYRNPSLPSQTPLHQPEPSVIYPSSTSRLANPHPSSHQSSSGANKSRPFRSGGWQTTEETTQPHLNTCPSPWHHTRKETRRRNPCPALMSPSREGID